LKHHVTWPFFTIQSFYLAAADMSEAAET